MKLVALFPRLIACALLCLTLSACVTTNTDAIYYNPASAGIYSNEIYGYNAVDFNALGVNNF